ncbi:MAG: toll/interleukin-1 receptor domain-containing protein [Planctomycetota bacterium]
MTEGDTKLLRAFVSYSTKDKIMAGEVGRALERVGVIPFLAHEDLRVSETWRERILDELRAAHILVAVLSQASRESDWAPQEIGFACANPDMLFIPLSLDETVPFGFISHIQSQRLVLASLEDLIQDPILRRFPRRFIPGLIDQVRSSSTFRVAEQRLGRLVPLFTSLTLVEAESLAEAIAANCQVHDAFRCRDAMIPEFLRIHGANLCESVSKELAIIMAGAL